MLLYKVTLQADERERLEAIIHKGSHQSQKVINALILLNCDVGEHNPQHIRGEDIANVLRIGARKIDRVKKRFVEEGLESALTRSPSERVYEVKADGEFEAHLVAMSCGKPPEGYAQWSLRLLADRAVELNYIDSVSYETVRRVLKKTKLSRGEKLAGSSRQKRTGSL